MADFNWTLYLILVVVAALGGVAVIPYAFALNKDKLAQSPLPRRTLALVTAVQTVVLYAILTFLGLLAADAVGLAVLSAPEILPLAVLLGVLGTVVLVLLEHYVFRPHLPDALKSADQNIALWKRFLGSFYGGINEEIMTRLFLVSGLVWLMSRIWPLTDGLFWAAIGLAAVIFGLGHLPATAAITRLTPLIIVRAILLNAIIGVLCGWLFWQHGLVAAIVAHFSGDIVIHIITPALTRRHTDAQHPPAAQAA